MKMDISDLIKNFETELLQPKVRKSKERLNELLSDDLYEIGESGKQYSKQDILNDLPKQTEVKITIQNFNAVEISPGIVLVTYQAEKEIAGNKTSSLRSSFWQNKNGKWQITFHQGTQIKNSD